MSVNLTTAIAAFAAGTAIVDLVTPGLASITSHGSPLASLSAIPGMSTASTTINSMVSSATTQWNSILSQLSVALPAMKAVHVLESKMAMASTPGIAPTTAGSTSFQAYFGAIDTVKTQVTNLQTSVTNSINTLGTSALSVSGVTGTGTAALTSLASKIPPATIPDGSGGTMTNPAYTSFMSTNSSTFSSMTTAANSLNSTVATANTAVTAQFSAASSAFTNGVNSLKACAFATFCAQPQPAAVSAVIAKTVDTTKVPSTAQLAVASQSTQTWMSAQNTTSTPVSGPDPVATTTTTVPTINTPPSDPNNFTASGCTAGQLSAIDSQVESQLAVATSTQSAFATAKQNLDALMKSLNWANIDKSTNPTGYQTTLNTILASPQRAAYDAAQGPYKTARQLYFRLQDIQMYMHKQGPLPGNPNGPWTMNDFLPGSSS
jgi:hypothetical protein